LLLILNYSAFIFAMEFLEEHLDWLKKELESFPETYFIFDCPGQIELYTHHKSVRHIVDQLQKWNYRITAVQLIDCQVCTQPTTYISALLLCLSTMMQLELPHINVLSKIDLIQQYGKLDFNLEFYTDVLDLSYLQNYLNQDPFSQQFKKMNQAICSLVEDYGLVAFYPLNIEDKDSVYNLLKVIDKSNGYIFGAFTEGNESIMEVAASELSWNYERVAVIQDKSTTETLAADWVLDEEDK